MAGDTINAASILKVGQRLAFFSGGDEQYSSRIEDITPNALVVAMPVDSKRRPVIPMKGEHLYGMALADRCQYRFFCVFKDKGLQNNLPCWWITKPDKVERHQNREFVRVRVSLPIQVQVTDKDGGFLPPQMTQVIDISGNGLSFSFANAVKVSSQVIMELRNLPNIGTLQVMGKVMRCDRIELAGDGFIYHVGVRMMNLTRPVRNKLIRYIFEIQRQELAKGLDTTGVAK